MISFDEHLKFDLEGDYYAFESIDDDGAKNVEIKYGRYFDDDGDECYEKHFRVTTLDSDSRSLDELDCDEVSIHIEGNIENRILLRTDTSAIMTISVTTHQAVIVLQGEQSIYLLVSGIGYSELDPESNEKLKMWADFLNEILASVQLDGIIGDFEKLTPEMLLAENHEVSDSDAPIPFATPQEGQHTHYDYLNVARTFAGKHGMSVNVTGAECEFQLFEDLIECNENGEDIIYSKSIAADTTPFPLADKAFAMSDLFRVDLNAFNSSHDRQQEIHRGRIQKNIYFEALRSFAWTLSAYCEKNDVSPDDIDLEQVVLIIKHVSKHFLNYTADSFSPTLCSGDDLHNYYIPDSVSERDRKEFIEFLEKSEATENDENDDYIPTDFSARIRSLDQLREELSYLYPVMQKLHDELAEDRDYSEALEDNAAADLLYAWCSMTYAARQPFFHEDGPMNCFYEHPDQQNLGKLNLLRNQQYNGTEWLRNHDKHITHNPSIIFSGKKFVFTGVEELDEWSTIQEKLEIKGGILRTGISGQTDYLVCNPRFAGDSKVRDALEQNKKGKNIKIILFEDFMKALGMEYNDISKGIAPINEDKDVKLSMTVNDALAPKSKDKSAAEKPHPAPKHEPTPKEITEEFIKELEERKEKNMQIREERKKQLEIALEELKNNLMAPVLKSYNEALDTQHERIKDCEKRKTEAEQRLESLGFFKFADKLEAKRTIQEMELALEEAKAAISNAEEIYSRAQTVAKEEQEKQRDNLAMQIRKRLPLEPVPYIPSNLDHQLLGAIEIIKLKIVETFDRYGRMTVDELMDRCSECSDFSNMRTSALVRQLVDENELKREYIKRVAYFDIVDE